MLQRQRMGAGGSERPRIVMRLDERQVQPIAVLHCAVQVIPGCIGCGDRSAVRTLDTSGIAVEAAPKPDNGDRTFLIFGRLLSCERKGSVKDQCENDDFLHRRRRDLKIYFAIMVYNG